MTRNLMICMLVVALSLPVFAATTVVVNGKTVTVPTIEKGGKAYVDVVTLMKLLGGKATYDAVKHKVMITTAAAASAPVTSASAAAQGTAQLPGDNGELGKLYTLGKSSPLYFCLKSAEFSTNRVVIGDSTYTPSSNQKVLVLRFTVQNPNKTDKWVRGDCSLRFMAVDAMDMNHKPVNTWGDAKGGDRVALSLKPAQKIDVYTAILVPAKGEIPKLMVLPENDNDGPVLRYDLRGKVTPLAAPFADPADATGATARATVPAQLGTAYPSGAFDLTLEKVEFLTEVPEGVPAIKKDERIFLATMLVKNATPREVYLRSDRLKQEVISVDGETFRPRDMFFATSFRPVATELKPGQELRVRLCFMVPKDVALTTFSIKQNADDFCYQFTLPQ